MPPAARVTDAHSCPVHGGGPVQPAGEPSVLIGFKHAAREGDVALCPGAPDAVARGEPTVLVGDKPAARRGDGTVHGGKVTGGCPTVFIGSMNQAVTLRTDKPFCEECDEEPPEDDAP